MERPDLPLEKEKPQDPLITSGSPAQEKARRAEHEEEEREEKERTRRESDG